MSEVPISVHEKTPLHTRVQKKLTVMYGSLTTVDSVCHYCAEVLHSKTYSNVWESDNSGQCLSLLCRGSAF